MQCSVIANVLIFLIVLAIQYTNFEEVTQEIEKEMRVGAGANKGISPIPIVLKIYSPNVVNLSLIDLPGLTKIPVGDQPKDIELKIIQMIKLYIQNPNSLILAISPANYDLANSDSLRIAREVDPEGERTLGVLTKMDICDEAEQMVDILEGRVYPLKLGYVGVKCRSQKEAIANVSMNQCLQNEEQFFAHHPTFKFYGQLTGIKNLTTKLNDYLVEHVRRCVPLIRQKMITLISDKEKERGQYGIISDFTDSVSSKGALLVSIINRYVRYYQETLRGEFFINNELCGGAKINIIFDEFRRQTRQIVPFEDISDFEFSISVKNICGLNNSLLISDKAFEILVKKEINKLRVPAFECLNQVFHELKSISTKITMRELEIMDNLKKALGSAMAGFLTALYKPAEGMINNIFKIETGFINTKHPEFIRARESIFKNNPQQLRKPSSQSEGWGLFGGSGGQDQLSIQEEVEELDIIKQLVSSYFGIVKNSIIDYIPKVVISFMVNESCQVCDQELVTQLYSDDKVHGLLSVSQELITKKQQVESDLQFLKQSQAELDAFELSTGTHYFRK